MKDFQFSIPQNVIVGTGCLKKLPEYVKKLNGVHPLIITGPHLAKMCVMAEMIASLEKEGLKVDVFSETEANPSTDTVEKAVKLYEDVKADVLIAFGGGSPMDVAKAVGAVVTYGGKVTDYEGAGKVPGIITPLIAIPTTAGTGSEVTPFAVITDHSRDYKLTISSVNLIPNYALLDASLLTTTPASVAAASGIDAFIHAEESYVSKKASPFTEVMSEKAMQLIGANIRAFVADRTNLEAAEGMLLGSLFAGIAFSWANLGNVHAMSHPVSAHFNLAHGVANAILLPVIVEYNGLADRGKYKKIYNFIARTPYCGLEFRQEDLVDALYELNSDLGIPAGLAEAGVTEDLIEVMAKDAMKSGNVAVNPRTTTLADMISLYHKAM
ncbi:MAG: iron-containing alcohol dehydrogenase [Lachnospiraceae bacterium]